jgi:hypothetical protein
MDIVLPCDADNTFIQLKADSIVIGWGQDATAGKIENRAVDGDKLTLAVNDSYAVNTYQLKLTKPIIPNGGCGKMLKRLRGLYMPARNRFTKK